MKDSFYFARYVRIEDKDISSIIFHLSRFTY